VIRLPHVVVSDAELVAAIQSISSEEFVQVHDFTTVLNERKTPQTVGFIVELSGQLSTFGRLTKGKTQPTAQQNTLQDRTRITAQRLFDALGAENNDINEYRSQCKVETHTSQRFESLSPGLP
jgi:hypothetical protein